MHANRNGKIVWGILALLFLYLLYDLFAPMQRDLRSFDPDEMARLETAMWESYYDRKPVKIYFELAEMLRTQFHFPYLRSYLGAYNAARAAFVFKDHTNDADLRKAEDILRSYFGLIHRTGNIPFDVEKAAEVELHWWIVHRKRNIYSEEQLGQACADAAAALYLIPPSSTLEHGQLRAAAMTIRDTKANEGGVRNEDWKRIEVLLNRCYHSLFAALQNPYR
jgi:hypothetical protein